MTTALKKVFINDRLKKQRSTIQQQLHSLQVKEGASGNISFDQHGDRKENTSLIVHIVPTQCLGFGAMFVPTNYDLTKLDCPSKDKELSNK